MTERELFEAIGYVDDDLILAADAPAKKRRKPPVYWRNLVSVAACACLFLGGVAVWQSGGLHTSTDTAAAYESAKAPDEAVSDEPMLSAASPQAEDAPEAAEGSSNMDSAESSIALGLARCVQIDGVRYFDSATLVDFIADRDADGIIENSVSYDVFPETDECSNFGTGYSYWVNGPKTVIVEIDGEYWQFSAN